MQSRSGTATPGRFFYLDYLQKYVKKLLTFNTTLHIIINVRLIRVKNPAELLPPRV